MSLGLRGGVTLCLRSKMLQGGGQDDIAIGTCMPRRGIVRHRSLGCLPSSADTGYTIYLRAKLTAGA